MPLWSVICRFQKANTKAKCKCKGKCIGKWFLCPKCGIYLLNAALKRDFSISECKYKGKMQMQRQMHRKMVFYALNSAFIVLKCRFEAWFFDFRMQIQRHNVNAKANRIGKWFLYYKCGIYILNAALKRDLSISEGKYKGKMQRQRQMHRKMVFIP